MMSGSLPLAILSSSRMAERVQLSAKTTPVVLLSGYVALRVAPACEVREIHSILTRMTGIPVERQRLVRGSDAWTLVVEAPLTAADPIASCFAWDGEENPMRASEKSKTTSTAL